MEMLSNPSENGINNNNGVSRALSIPPGIVMPASMMLGGGGTGRSRANTSSIFVKTTTNQ